MTQHSSLPIDHGATSGRADDDHTEYALLAGRAGDVLILADDAAAPPLRMTPRSVVPTAPSAGDIYLDDGTNTAGAVPGLRAYVAGAWVDL